jgi:hypothetical protein
MRIVSPAHFPDVQKANDNKQTHPHQSIFFEKTTYQDPVDLQAHIPELSSIRLNKKLFNNRLQNDPNDLKNQISGAKRDITELTRLVQGLQRYRSNIHDMKNLATITKSASTIGGS